MPDKPLVGAVFLWTSFLICSLTLAKGSVFADEGIACFYVRLDIHSSANRIQNENLIMVPSKNDFRAEKFSQVSVSGVISATPGESNESTQKRIKENALKTILLNNGLKSVKTKDYDTVVSYEGVIITPLTLRKNTYLEERSEYMYEVKIDFCPIAFPDRWETLNMKHRIKEMAYDFFQLFK